MIKFGKKNYTVIVVISSRNLFFVQVKYKTLATFFLCLAIITGILSTQMLLAHLDYGKPDLSINFVVHKANLWKERKYNCVSHPLVFRRNRPVPTFTLVVLHSFTVSICKLPSQRWKCVSLYSVKFCKHFLSMHFNYKSRALWLACTKPVLHFLIFRAYTLKSNLFLSLLRMGEKRLPRGAFKTQFNIYDWAFLIK